MGLIINNYGTIEMSSYSRSRKKRIRNAKVFIENVDAQIGRNLVFQVHQIPSEIKYGDSCDFWIIDSKDVYLLTLKISKEQRISFSRPNPESQINCMMLIDSVAMEMEEQLSKLEKVGIPHRMKGVINWTF